MKDIENGMVMQEPTLRTEITQFVKSQAIEDYLNNQDFNFRMAEKIRHENELKKLAKVV